MRSIICALVLCIAACSSGEGGGVGKTTVDAAVQPDSGLQNQCGHPGDPGNDMGVGKYCDGLAECSGLAAGLCATLGDPNAHFCTKPCASGSTTACGTNATCACQGGQCGCVPNACL